MQQNLELKARCHDLTAIRQKVLALPPHSAFVEDQTDTYFQVTTGRLKLREIAGQGAELIWYDRPDDAGTRLSRYLRTPILDPLTVKAQLIAGLGLRGIVRKRREIFLWHNVRIHLDEVEGLGSFLEFEAVLGPESDTDLSQRRLGELAQALAITADQLQAPSYADLIG